jgi:hypothetical protein
LTESLKNILSFDPAPPPFLASFKCQLEYFLTLADLVCSCLRHYKNKNTELINCAGTVLRFQQTKPNLFIYHTLKINWTWFRSIKLVIRISKSAG